MQKISYNITVFSLTEVSRNGTEVLNAKEYHKIQQFFSFFLLTVVLLCSACLSMPSHVTDQSKPNLMDLVWPWGQGFTSL